MTIDIARLRNLLIALEKAACKGVDKWVALHPHAPTVRKMQLQITNNGTFIFFPDSFGLAQDIRDECSDKWPAVVQQTNALREMMPTMAMPFTADYEIMAYHTDKGIVHKVEDRVYLPAVVSANCRARAGNPITELGTLLNKLALISTQKTPAELAPWTVSKTPKQDPESPMVQNHPVFLGTVYARTQEEANLKAAAMLLYTKDFEALVDGTITEHTQTDLDRVTVSKAASNLLGSFSEKETLLTA